MLASQPKIFGNQLTHFHITLESKEKAEGKREPVLNQMTHQNLWRASGAVLRGNACIRKDVLRSMSLAPTFKKQEEEEKLERGNQSGERKA